MHYVWPTDRKTCQWRPGNNSRIYILHVLHGPHSICPSPHAILRMRRANLGGAEGGGQWDLTLLLRKIKTWLISHSTCTSFVLFFFSKWVDFPRTLSCISIAQRTVHFFFTWCYLTRIYYFLCCLTSIKSQKISRFIYVSSIWNVCVVSRKTKSINPFLESFCDFH